ncbi:helix-turn-helix domain-containing protein [Heyndrickxia sporothermodurans]|uniref:helix-turn-helix domain-containing protein n=1 Tax=Heyndrickxia sporothermodurans TaxID=46224 RepID=UPI0035DADAB9
MNNVVFKNARLFLDKTQADFAQMLGMSTQQVGRIETGSLPVSTRARAKLLANFDVSNPTF